MILSCKQQFVIGHAALSFPLKQIASMMGVSQKAVEKHAEKSRKKLMLPKSAKSSGVWVIVAIDENLIEYDVNKNEWSYCGADLDL